MVPATGLRRITWDVVHYWCAAGTNNAKLKTGNWLWPGPLNEPVGLPNFCERQDLNPRSQRAIGQVSEISVSPSFQRIYAHLVVFVRRTAR